MQTLVEMQHKKVPIRIATVCQYNFEPDLLNTLPNISEQHQQLSDVTTFCSVVNEERSLTIKNKYSRPSLLNTSSIILNYKVQF